MKISSITNSLSLTFLLLILLGCGADSSNEFKHQIKVGDEVVSIGYRGNDLDDFAWQFLISDIDRFAVSESLVIAEDGGRRYVVVKYPFGPSYQLNESKRGTAYEIPEHMVRAYNGSAESIQYGGYSDHSLVAFVDRLNQHHGHSIRSDILPSRREVYSDEQLDWLEAVDFYLFDEDLAKTMWFDVDGRERTPGVVIGYSMPADAEESNDAGLKVRLSVFVDGRWYLWR